MCTKLLHIVKLPYFSAKRLSASLFTVDKDFKWANTGATVFGAQTPRKADEDEGDSGDEVVHNDDIHFEPIVSLPEVKKLPEYKRTLR